MYCFLSTMGFAQVPTRYYDSTMAAVEALRSDGYRVYAMETTERSASYVDIQYPHRTALVLGNEVTGVDTAVLEQCDGIVEIPTFGLKNSLNVAAAAPIVVFEVLRQWGLMAASDDHKSASGSSGQDPAPPHAKRTKPKWETDIGGF